MLAALGLMACESEPGETTTGTVTTGSGSGTSGGSSSGGTSGGSGTGSAEQGVVVNVWVPDVSEGAWSGEWVAGEEVPVQVFEGLGPEYIDEDTTHWGSGVSGSMIPLPAYDDFFVAVGSMEKRSDANGWMPVYSADDGWMWIAPGQSVGAIETGKTVELDVYMNAFAEGSWTCTDDYYGNIDTGSVEYFSGNILSFQDRSDMLVDGVALLPHEGDAEGSFLTATHASFSYFSSVEGLDINIECWQGNSGARP